MIDIEHYIEQLNEWESCTAEMYCCIEKTFHNAALVYAFLKMNNSVDEKKELTLNYLTQTFEVAIEMLLVNINKLFDTSKNTCSLYKYKDLLHKNHYGYFNNTGKKQIFEKKLGDLIRKYNEEKWKEFRHKIIAHNDENTLIHGIKESAIEIQDIFKLLDDILPVYNEICIYSEQMTFGYRL